PLTSPRRITCALSSALRREASILALSQKPIRFPFTARYQLLLTEAEASVPAAAPS
ncbi:hypothetical protein HispidOSU_010989, partial [Sigmodon hispidus]